jgi:peptide/nickel transport system substrate-binding protein
MKRLLLFIILFGLALAACRPQTETPTPGISQTIQPTATTYPTPSQTPDPPRTLTVCVAQMPETLFPYDGLNSWPKTNLLTILYEAPYEIVRETVLPVILDRAPSLANGDLRLEPVNVQRGQTVVDAEGDLAVFQPGLAVRPSGCHEADCALVWDGESQLQMDQMVVDYHLREDLAWSDGVPVTAVDSVFSFQLAIDSDAPGLHWAEDRTENYQALGSDTLQWTGRPGFSTWDLSRFFWRPLAAHLFDGDISWSEIANSEKLTRTPLSYGPFQIKSWDGGGILLIPNPHYHQASEGLPLLDKVVFRQVEGGREAAIKGLQAGECDVLDVSFGWENDLALLTEITANGSAEVHTQTGGAWWQLVFGINQAAYDDGYNPALGDRPDYFGDPLVRKAIAACLDREAMRTRALGEWGQLWSSFLPPEETRLSPEERIIYNPEQASADLEAAGWLDMDSDPATSRIAVNLPEVPPGTEFRLELLVDTTQFQQDMGAFIQESLAACGIGVTVEALPSEQLYAPGPNGPLFGRQFDLALIAWEASPMLDCRLYLNQAIPTSDNQWVGTNISGLDQQDYDLACAAAGLAAEDNWPATARQAELVFINHLPVIPLFSPPQATVYSSALCVEELLTAGNEFFNRIERITGDKNCP